MNLKSSTLALPVATMWSASFTAPPMYTCGGDWRWMGQSAQKTKNACEQTAAALLRCRGQASAAAHGNKLKLQWLFRGPEGGAKDNHFARMVRTKTESMDANMHSTSGCDQKAVPRLNSPLGLSPCCRRACPARKDAISARSPPLYKQRRQGSVDGIPCHRAVSD